MMTGCEGRSGEAVGTEDVLQGRQGTVADLVAGVNNPLYSLLVRC